VVDSLQALTIFVAFVTVLFGLRYSTIATAITKELSPKGMKVARRDEKDKLGRLFWSQCVPLAMLTGAPVFLFLPLSLRIMRHSSFSLLGFDTLRTGFVLLFIYMAFFFCWSMFLGLRLHRKAHEKDA
jgi:hypothetical protein